MWVDVHYYSGVHAYAYTHCTKSRGFYWHQQSIISIHAAVNILVRRSSASTQNDIWFMQSITCCANIPLTAPYSYTQRPETEVPS